MLCLIARFEAETISIALPAGSARIGSAAENDIVLPFPGVSHHHAVAERVDDGLLLKDEGSRNGLRVEGRRQSQVLLRADGLVMLGRAALTLENVSDSDVELAFELERRPPIRRNGEARRETDDGTSPAEKSSTRDAVRLVRDLAAREPGRPDARLLARTRAVLGCQALLLLSESQSKGFVVEERHGESPGDHEFADLLVEIGARGFGEVTNSLQIESHRMGLIAIARPKTGRGAVGIVYSGSEAILDSWRRELLQYFADMVLGNGAGAPGASARAAASGRLVLPPGMVVGEAPASRELLREVEATVGSGLDVLLLGETGTGKEYFAKLIHASGPTPGGPFVAVNCAAIPSELLEAELFGVHGRVATGVEPRPGQIALAQGGTVFLDEVGELAQPLQAKLLRFLQEREILPLGAPEPRRVSVRVVSASNRDLEKEAHEGRFRSDLYYRLRGLQYVIPPLRERRGDIPALAVAFANRAAADFGRDIRGFSRVALELLLEHDWPGNVRELEAEVKRAVLLRLPGEVLRPEHFGSVSFAIAEKRRSGLVDRATTFETEPSVSSGTGPGSMRLDARIEAVERKAIELALASSKGNRSLAARLLGITRNGLAMKISRLAGPRE